MKPYISRKIYKDRIEKFIGKELIKVLIGQRRVGKSYLLFQTIDSIRDRFPQANIIYINLELNEFESITTYKELYDFIKLKTVDGELNFVLIDEVQVIPEFERALKGLLAEGGHDIYCTGSNARLLSAEFGTLLGGRYIEIPVHTLNYREFLEFHKLENSSESLNNYLKYGGLPYLIHLELTDDTIFDYLRNINQSILFRDVVSRFQIRNVNFLLRLIKYLSNEIGHIITARNIVKYLRSQNINISVNVVLSYLDYLSTAMLVSSVKRADIQGKKVFEIGEKYYFNDLGIRNVISGYSPFDMGQMIENIVYLHLKTIGYSILIGKKDDKEVDFIAEREGEKIYLQVALRIVEDQTRKREFESLLSIKDNYPKYVITMDDFAGVSYEGIRHIPLRQFLYEFS